MSSSGVNALETCRIPLEEIIRATNHFSSENKVGEGGFGAVYRGKLSEQWKNRLVAIKRLDPTSFQGHNEFNNELEMFSIFNHPNIIPFIGYCSEANEKILVYEYATNGSLDQHLQDPNKKLRLTWTQRLKICLGAARGIKHLHSGVGDSMRVIHRDVKSANILLDDNLEAKISDFGLSRFCPRNQRDTQVCTKTSGTKSYIDPIYSERGRLSKESDIYSFGVVMFEISSGTMAYNRRQFEDAKEQYLIDLVRSHYDDRELVGGFNKLIDTDIKGQINYLSFHTFNKTAHECISLDLKTRPTMDKIIKSIEEALNIQSFPKDNENRAKHYMLGPTDLTIEWQHDTRYWYLGYIPESRFPKVWILKGVQWLQINGKLSAVMLAPNSTYVAYLVFRTTKSSRGLSVPATTMISFDRKKMETENVYLQRPELVQGEEQIEGQENYVFPQQREDGWMEIKLGEFDCSEGDDGDVVMMFKEVHTGWKTGLIVEGIEIRSK